MGSLSDAILRFLQRALLPSEYARINSEITKKETRKESFEKSNLQQLSGGVATGFVEFDEIIGKLQPAELAVIGGRPGMGKSAFAINVAEHIALNQNKSVLFFNLETTRDALTERMLLSMAGINANRLKHGMSIGRLTDEDFLHVAGMIENLAKNSIYIDDSLFVTPEALCDQARRAKNEDNKLSLIIVDYLQLMLKADENERLIESSKIMRSLKNLAIELNVPIVILAQLNRALELRDDKHPIISDLRQSEAIKQEADLITFIYRDEIYNKKTPDKGIAELIVAKQRNVHTGNVKLAFSGANPCCRFDNLDQAEIA